MKFRGQQSPADVRLSCCCFCFRSVCWSSRTSCWKLSGVCCRRVPWTAPKSSPCTKPTLPPCKNTWTYLIMTSSDMTWRIKLYTDNWMISKQSETFFVFLSFEFSLWKHANAIKICVPKFWCISDLNRRATRRSMQRKSLSSVKRWAPHLLEKKTLYILVSFSTSQSVLLNLANL